MGLFVAVVMAIIGRQRQTAWTLRGISILTHLTQTQGAEQTIDTVLISAVLHDNSGWHSKHISQEFPNLIFDSIEQTKEILNEF